MPAMLHSTIFYAYFKQLNVTEIIWDSSVLQKCEKEFILKHET